jgi:curved DNA-binding protein CbpA
MRDYYAILGLTRDMSAGMVRKRYLMLAKRWHPDKPTGDVKRFQEIQEAYGVLGDPAKRRAYDLQSKVREFVPKADAGGALDLVDLLKKAAAGRVPSQFVDQLTPVMERKLDEHGIKAKAVTAEDVMQALGWLKPKRKKRA